MAEKIVVVDNPLITVWVYPERKIIHHTMKAFCYGPGFRDALMKGVDAMRLHQATKWLSDDRANGAMLKEDEEWGTTNWLPRALAAGWKYWAIVKPEKVIGQISMQRAVVSLAEAGITGRLFSDPDEAMAWLESV